MLTRPSFPFSFAAAGAALAMAISAAAADLPALAKQYETDVRPILTDLCYRCHGIEKKKADLDLARLKTGDDALKAEVWQNVIERVNAHEMPPEGARQLNDEQRAKLLGWAGALPKTSDDCTKIATDKTVNFYRGYVMSRRLNRSEYNNTIRDLVGLDLKPGDIFPNDGAGGEGFDTSGDALFTTPILMEKYLDAADHVLTAVLGDGGASLPLPLGEGRGEGRITPSSKFTPAQLTAARKKLLIAQPSDKLTPRDAAKQILAAFIRRAYRRPTTDADIDRALTMYDRAAKRGDPHEASLRLALKSVLISPNFLFLVEPEPAKEGVYRLGPVPLASRLSYFLWSSMPDDELLAAAESGKLLEKDVLLQQVRRMLKDPRARALGESFAIQWLALEPLGTTVKPDAKKFPQFDAALSSAMREEAIALFHHVVSHDRSLLELIDSDYTFVNQRLAEHYGLPSAEVKGDALRQVKLTDRQRGGVLGLAAVQTVTSFPLRTSPVLRGKWVLEELLGSKVPPPPPNVPTLPADDAAKEGLTFRQQLELHRKNPECASCHARMDPLGFGLEQFDPIGRYRATLNGQPIDAAGTLPSGEKFSNVAELKSVLMKKKDEVVRHLGRKMLGYALGRKLSKLDDCVLDDVMKALKANEYRASAMIETIVMSRAFQYRYAKK